MPNHTALNNFVAGPRLAGPGRSGQAAQADCQQTQQRQEPSIQTISHAARAKTTYFKPAFTSAFKLYAGPSFKTTFTSDSMADSTADVTS